MVSLDELLATSRGLGMRPLMARVLSRREILRARLLKVGGRSSRHYETLVCAPGDNALNPSIGKLTATRLVPKTGLLPPVARGRKT